MSHTKLSFIKFIFLFSFLNSSLMYAGALEFYFQRELNQKHSPFLTTVKENYFTQIIDHDNPSGGVFKQRYFIDETYSKGIDAPVFFLHLWRI